MLLRVRSPAAIENLSRLTGIPAERLIRYVLVKYAASASDALLSMQPIVFGQMQAAIKQADEEGSDEARLRAYETLRQIVSWLGLAGDNA